MQHDFLVPKGLTSKFIMIEGKLKSDKGMTTEIKRFNGQACKSLEDLPQIATLFNDPMTVLNKTRLLFFGTLGYRSKNGSVNCVLRLRRRNTHWQKFSSFDIILFRAGLGPLQALGQKA